MEKEQFSRILGDQIKAARTGAKMTQNEVALRMEMDAQNFSKYERGLIAPTVYWISKFCTATGKDFSEFMAGFGNKI